MKFSILLPTRNRLDLLRYAVESVTRQDYDDWEIIISDNFSEEDIKGYVDSLHDARIVYRRTEQFISVTDNWNNSLNLASGDYMIMLGDDDALMPGYFRKMDELINQYQQPDFIYTDAYLFAYAGALPYSPESMLRYGYNTYFPSRQPFLIERAAADELVRQSLNLDMPIFYNMQLSTIRMDFIRSLAAHGAFFQSPFPDYYATVATFLKAARIVIYQQPLAIIGVSKKSFGSYFNLGRDKEGESFLNNVSEQQSSRLRSILLPRSVDINCRLIAMDTVAVNYPDEVKKAGAAVNYAKYRRLTIRFGYANHYLRKLLSGEDLAAIRAALTPGEKLYYGIPYTIFYGLLGLLSMDQFQRLKRLIQSWGLLSSTSAWQVTSCQTAMDVFEQLPTTLDSSKA